MSKNVVRLKSFRDLETASDSDERPQARPSSQKGGTKPPRQVVTNDELRSDLPLNTCLRPGCKNTFRLPWGYHEGVRPDRVTEKDWRNRTLPLWPGACTGPCFAKLVQLQRDQSLKSEAAFFVRIATRNRQAEMAQLQPA